MRDREMFQKKMEEFCCFLQEEEKSSVTIEKYCRDVSAVWEYVKKDVYGDLGAEEKINTVGDNDTYSFYIAKIPVTKDMTVTYKKHLQEHGYAIRSINSMLASLNRFFHFMGWEDCRVKTLRCQRETYCAEEKELTKAEYKRLLAASQKHPQLHLVLQTICGTGIRVSELQYFTVEGVRKGTITVRCKNKSRKILLPGNLRTLLLTYAAKRNITRGPIFITRGGLPLDRSNIWSQMKRLCRDAHVEPSKVFPHNLRKLFARTFYGIDKDIAKLADILGHGSIETTRIYIMTTGHEHRRQIERLGLVG